MSRRKNESTIFGFVASSSASDDGAPTPDDVVFNLEEYASEFWQFAREAGVFPPSRPTRASGRAVGERHNPFSVIVSGSTRHFPTNVCPSCETGRCAHPRTSWKYVGAGGVTVVL